MEANSQLNTVSQTSKLDGILNNRYLLPLLILVESISLFFATKNNAQDLLSSATFTYFIAPSVFLISACLVLIYSSRLVLVRKQDKLIVWWFFAAVAFLMLSGLALSILSVFGLRVNLIYIEALSNLFRYAAFYPAALGIFAITGIVLWSAITSTEPSSSRAKIGRYVLTGLVLVGIAVALWDILFDFALSRSKLF